MFYKVLLILVSIFLAWVVYRLILNRIESNRQRSAFNLIFEKFGNTKPNLVIGSSYGYPSFGVIFKTKEDMDKALREGFIDQFTVKIQELCQLPSDTGKETWSFDAKRAIYTMYEGRPSLFE
jgi:hypothetical protein